MTRSQLGRACPACQAVLPALAVRCPACDHALPEGRDLRSDPDEPRCGVCQTAMGLMDQRCPQCGAVGYPALRPRQGRKCQTAGDETRLRTPSD